MPEVRKEAPPRRQASWSFLAISGPSACGCTSPTTELDTTFLPDSRMRHMSSMASIRRVSAVAV
jgi:hypothetical protein